MTAGIDSGVPSENAFPDAFDYRRDALFLRRHLGPRETGLLRDGIDDGVVEERPAQGMCDALRDLGPARAVHARDRDEGHRWATR